MLVASREHAEKCVARLQKTSISKIPGQGAGTEGRGHVARRPPHPSCHKGVAFSKMGLGGGRDALARVQVLRRAADAAQFAPVDLSRHSLRRGQRPTSSAACCRRRHVRLVGVVRGRGPFCE